jgi:hypothetical protein
MRKINHACVEGSPGKLQRHYLKKPHFQWVAPLAWCHRCAQLIRAENGAAIPTGLGLHYWKYRRQSNNQQARMSPAERNTSVAPDSAAALSRCVATDGSRWLAGIPHSRLIVPARPYVARLSVHSYYSFALLCFLVKAGLNLCR